MCMLKRPDRQIWGTSGCRGTRVCRQTDARCALNSEPLRAGHHKKQLLGLYNQTGGKLCKSRMAAELTLWVQSLCYVQRVALLLLIRCVSLSHLISMWGISLLCGGIFTKQTHKRRFPLSLLCGFKYPMSWFARILLYARFLHMVS